MNGLNVLTIEGFQKEKGLSNDAFFCLWGLGPNNLSTWKDYIVVGNDELGWAVYSKRRDVPELTDRSG